MYGFTGNLISGTETIPVATAIHRRTSSIVDATEVNLHRRRTSESVIPRSPLSGRSPDQMDSNPDERDGTISPMISSPHRFSSPRREAMPRRLSLFAEADATREPVVMLAVSYDSSQIAEDDSLNASDDCLTD